MLHQTLISIQNRIRRFSVGPLKKIFATRYNVNIKNLLDKNVIIDLSTIIKLRGEKEDALFFLNMILKYLWDENLTRGSYNFTDIKHVTIVEDVQYFAPSDLSSQTKLSSYLEDIVLLQRGTGECLISLATRPKVSEEILANCGVLIIFKNHMQRRLICELLNLEEESGEFLSFLEGGQCIIRLSSLKRPFLLNVPYIKRDWLTRGDVNRNNKLVLKKYNDQDNNNNKKDHTSSKKKLKKSKEDIPAIKVTNRDENKRDIDVNIDPNGIIENLKKSFSNEKIHPLKYKSLKESEEFKQFIENLVKNEKKIQK